MLNLLFSEDLKTSSKRGVYTDNCAVHYSLLVFEKIEIFL
jgi:hypothetical protein